MTVSTIRGGRSQPTVALRPVAAAFVVFGAFLGAWAVAIADIERALGLGHGGFGLVLAVALGASAVANAVGGSLVERFGTSAVLAASLLAWGVLLLAVGAMGAGPAALLGAVLVVTVAVGGVVDVAMNVAATTALVDQPGRLVRFHAFFNGGAALGALLAGVALRSGADWRVVVAVPGLIAMVLAPVVRAAASEAERAATRQPVGAGPLRSLRAVRAAGLGLLALVFACSAMVEGGIDTWGVLILREQLDLGVAVGAGAYVIGQLIATAARAGLGPLAGGLGPERGVAVGGGLAAVGLTMVALAPGLAAAVGLVLAMAGITVCWPLLLAAAAQGRERPGAVIGGVTAVGYLGMVVGPPLVGTIAGWVGLRPAVGVLAALAALVAMAPARLHLGTPTT